MTAGLPLYLLAALAVGGALVMLAARHPMRVALGLIATMLALAGVYADLGAHVVAVFQVLIYVGAVMVFMVFVIMLLDTRDPSFVARYSRLLLPGVAAVAALVALLGALLVGRGVAPARVAGAADFHLQPFSAAFLAEYWLPFELTSVLLVVVVVAAIAVIRGRGGRDG
ncbi:MAG: NADH-quinone oxidoreductase subunit J [Proteobacteria bacterium]|nr:NADH-quinone oxidoreductase subunit J [Pseudomonadota bacterium]